jgi:uncharacterized protein YyaL (SSP411 family)
MHALSNTAKDIQGKGENIERSIIDEAAVGLLQMGDPIYGGFGQAPKFPNTSNLLFLLRYYDISQISRFKDFVMFSADKMAAGGIHDHLGGGFARYSTDQKWLVPHFEKMLYDNALLTQLYAELYQISGNVKYLKIVDKILEYVIAEMTSPEGGFYSAQDADSEGEEGKFYVWSKQEIVNVLEDKTNSDIFCEYYGITEAGNFEGKNILNIRNSLTHLAQKYHMTTEAIEDVINDASKRLFEVRSKRVRPGQDDKILTSWNGLMISGFAKGYKITGNKKYLDAAINAVNFIESKIAKNDGRLQRAFKDGISKLNAYLDDYAFYVNALLDLFEIYAQPTYLQKAIVYTNFMIQHFWDPEGGSFFFTSDDHEQLIVRTKSFYDLAIPSGNSMAVSNLLRLYHFIQNNDYLYKAEHIMREGAKTASENPFGFGHLLIAMYLYIKKPVEITIIRNTEKQRANSEMVNWVNRQFIPNGIIAIIENKSQLQELQNYPFFKGRNLVQENQKDSDYALVCRNFSCSLPINSIQELERLVRMP